MWYIKDMRTSKIYGPFYSTVKAQLYAYEEKIKEYKVVSDSRVVCHPIFVPNERR